jgi:hypothetical protein
MNLGAYSVSHGVFWDDILVDLSEADEELLRLDADSPCGRDCREAFDLMRVAVSNLKATHPHNEHLAACWKAVWNTWQVLYFG